MGPTLDELRDLSARNKRANAWGGLAMLGTLALFPTLALVASFAPRWFWVATYAAAVASGAAFVTYSYHAGMSRGAFRRVFRRLKVEARAARGTPAWSGDGEKREG